MNQRNYRNGAKAAVAAGALYAVSAVLHVTGARDSGEKVESVAGHILLGVFAVVLALSIPAMFALARHAKSDLGARIAAPGLGLLSVLVTIVTINGEDPSYFVVLAPIANALWLVGSIVLAVSLHKAGRVPRAVVITLPLVQVLALPLSVIGGPIVSGIYWLTVGYLMQAGALERPAGRAAAATA